MDSENADSFPVKEALQTRCGEHFAGVMLIEKESEQRSIEDYFAEYDFWERYSETKQYNKRKYQAAYKGILREYKDYLYILVTDQSEEWYVVAKRVPNELDSLVSYCICTRCTMLSINPLKYMWCPHCTKCIKAGPGFTNEEYIIRARERKTAAKTKTYVSYFQEISWITISELVVFVSTIFGIFFICFWS